MQEWINEELSTVELGDERVDRRYGVVLDALSAKPSASIPTACRGWHETKAAYDFFDNDRVSTKKLLAPHRDATLKRMAEYEVVLLTQDTTEVDLTRKQERVGGPLNDEDQYGLLSHCLLATTTEGMPLGIIHAEIWARDPADFHKRSERRSKPIEEKESFRWLEGYREACRVAQVVPDTQVVCVADSESDIYECFAETVWNEEKDTVRAHLIVRACQNRAVCSDEERTLWAAAEAAKPQPLKMTLEVRERSAQCGDDSRRRQARSARTAIVSVRAVEVTLKAPYRRGHKLPAATLHVVLVREDNPPAGEPPIEWLLLTTLPIDTIPNIELIISYYCRRWEIEVFFRVLKSGCRVEDRQFETTERMTACLTLYLIVAWRVLYVLRLGRECPELSCEVVFHPDEWRSVYAVVTNKTPPKRPPSLGEIVTMVASLGGYLDRTNDGPPGPKAMWVGMQRMHDFAIAWAAANLRIKNCV